MNPGSLLLVILACGILGIVIWESSKMMAKCPDSFYAWEVPATSKRRHAGHEVALIKQAAGYQVYFPSDSDSVWGRPFWVPLSIMCMGEPCGPVTFKTEIEALAAFAAYRKASSQGAWV